MRTADDILSAFVARKPKYAALHAMQQQVKDIYNDDVHVDLPGLSKKDKPTVPNILKQGVDQMSGRVTSTNPSTYFAPKEPGVRKWERNADNAGRAISAYNQLDAYMVKEKIRSRRYLAYGMGPVSIRWDFKEHRPFRQIRHPLECFPSLDIEPGQAAPTDVFFEYNRTVGWMCEQGYEEHVRVLTNQRYGEMNRDAIVTLVEYIDEERCLLLATGYYGNPEAFMHGSGSKMRAVVIKDYPNMARFVPCSIPTRITLDQMTGQFDNMIPIYYRQSELMALELIAIRKGIFPDTYLKSYPGETARIVAGPFPGVSGDITELQGGEVYTLNEQPGYMTPAMIDRLERAQRLNANVPGELGGESGSNIRTARRGDQVLSSAIDFPIAEAQEGIALAMIYEHRVMMQMAKRIDGDTERKFYVAQGNSFKPVTIKATETFEIEEHVVAYPASGSDANELVIGIGQRVGLGIMSKKTAAALDPFVDSPEGEHDQIVAEAIEESVIIAFREGCANGSIPGVVAGRVAELVANDRLEIYEAIKKATDEALAEQAKQQAAAQAGQPAPPMDANAAAAGAAVQAFAGVPSPDQTMPGMRNLSDLMRNIRMPTATMQPYRGAEQGAM